MMVVGRTEEICRVLETAQEADGRHLPCSLLGNLSYGVHSCNVLGEQGQVGISRQQICLGSRDKRDGAGQF